MPTSSQLATLILSRAADLKPMPSYPHGLDTLWWGIQGFAVIGAIGLFLVMMGTTSGRQLPLDERISISMMPFAAFIALMFLPSPRLVAQEHAKIDKKVCSYDTDLAALWQKAMKADFTRWRRWKPGPSGPVGKRFCCFLRSASGRLDIGC